MTHRDNSLPPDNRTIRIELRPATEADVDEYIRGLLRANWNAPDSPIQLTDDLSIGEVRHVLLFDQARRFLRLMDENKGAPLTAAGNLNRAYVAQMIERMDWPRRLMAPLLKDGLFKVVNEDDAWPLAVIHSVCEYGKLIYKRRNRAFVAGKGRELLADAQAGRLYRQLFITLFRNFDLGYLSGCLETPLVQDSIAVVLWRLQMMARDWIAAESLPREVYLAAVHDQTRAVSPWPTAGSDVLRHEVLEPLVWFGLLETDQQDDDRHRPRNEAKFRKTPLFDRFLSFIWFP